MRVGVGARSPPPATPEPHEASHGLPEARRPPPDPLVVGPAPLVEQLRPRDQELLRRCR